MDYVYIGRIVNTHGIKGELRIRSDFELKDQVFKNGGNIYIGSDYVKEEIVSYRVHKEFDMICLKGYKDINEVLKYLKKDVYVLRSDLKIDDYLLEDLINMDVVLDDEVIGKVTDIVYNKSNKLIYVVGKKNFYIPIVNEFIDKVLKEDKKIIVKEITKGLM